jgi:phosphatidylethanolamine/phosphatidyl-N-methylethanolamine N-methyltransferase
MEPPKGTKRPLSTRPWLDNARFFRSWLANPRAVGAVLPSSPQLARRMAALIDPHSPLPVLELGPGTGIITQAILERGVRPERIVAVERSPELGAHLAIGFPHIEIVYGDAFKLAETLAHHQATRFGCAISGLPLLNHSVSARIALVDGVLDRLAPGAPLVQFTYGLSEPVPSRNQNFEARRASFILCNVPPAHVWVYRRPVAGG